MATQPIDRPVTPLRQRMLDDMAMRAMGARTQHDYIRHVRAFAGFLGRSPDTATVEDVRRFQLHQREHGVGESWRRSKRTIEPVMICSSLSTSPSDMASHDHGRKR